jgi:hypothetical protein
MLAVLAVLCVGGAGDATSGAAQEMDDPARLTGVTSVAARASAVWDELITTSAGGATPEQFREALAMGFEQALRATEGGPRYDPDAATSVLCHVDTFYEAGLIVYSVRVSLHEPDDRGRTVITWLESSVGSYTVQQLHLVWTLADQCANSFLDGWRSANPRG